MGSERLQHCGHNSILLLENKSYSYWHEMKVGKGRESGDISKSRKRIIAVQDWFCLNWVYILQTHTQPSFTCPAGSQGLKFLADKLMQILQKNPAKGQSGHGRYCLDLGDKNLVLVSGRDPLHKLGQDVTPSLPPHPFGLVSVSH